ncbi:kinesin, putative [Trypanosoma equiperdum]|uniref:Kinesin, putative n=2 Tax=Trypanozoon TaxID=39700 RepID=Q57XU6_TRYB2|nr:kinesin, putative [Trypanosoma brucei brucei TREU927]AAX69573.1 kinesin, putative [Trypanosoma brucei]AAZ12787.1 kinesin, putative [Trypanosoma brucei brucei TREU927]SCU65719.1 kinesin, putative [Trypanosoma equiperdum]
MGKSEGIRVFLRIRPAAKGLPRPLNGVGSVRGADDTQNYSVEHTFEHSTVRFHVDRRTDADVVNNTREDFTFTFRRAFEPNATQADVFNTVAKDCVLAALDGYNSTVFAYGQTGSGKTHSITGGAESYEDRGIIPRALALLYEEIARRQQQEGTYSVAISYLQIYNDKGQDLLNRGHDARKLEDLPVVTIHDGGSDSDEVALRGLAQHSAATPKDALNLLFLGDTNRLYCETPMNKTSSRSHCVFTIYLEARPHGASVVRRSKLHFVDLAGSERVAKTGVSGTVLTEAKYINLSLHYLEQVIMALSEQANGRREHVPFRNSFMTMVLRDSLGPNCKTSMLATAHPAVDQLPETISTCRFAQRVALIKQDAHVNEEVDPHVLVRKLKAELQQMRDRLAFYTKDGGGAPDRDLSDDEKLRCEEMVKRFIAATDGNAKLEGFDGDLARIYYCFDVLKRMLAEGGAGVRVGGCGAGSSGGLSEQQQQQLDMYRSRVDALELCVKQKENEMNMLFDALQKVHRAKYNAETQTGADDGESSNYASRTKTAPGTGGSVEGGHAAPFQKPLGHPSNGAHMYASAAAAQQPHGMNVVEAGHSSNAGSIRYDGQDSPQALRRMACERLAPAEVTAVDEFFEKQQQLNEVYDLSSLTDAELLQDRATAFEAFSRSYRQCAQMESNKQELKARYETCKTTARQLNEVVDQIRKLKGCIQRLRAERVLQGVEEVDEAERNALEELAAHKTSYNDLAASLRQQKESIDAMHLFMKRAQEQLTKDFEDWLQIRQKQLIMAVKAGGYKNADSSGSSNGVSIASNTTTMSNNIATPQVNPTTTAAVTTATIPPPTEKAPPTAAAASPGRPTCFKPRLNFLQEQMQSKQQLGEQKPASASMPDLPPLREGLSSRRSWGCDGGMQLRGGLLHTGGLGSAPTHTRASSDTECGRLHHSVPATLSQQSTPNNRLGQPSTMVPLGGSALRNGWTGGSSSGAINDNNGNGYGVTSGISAGGAGLDAPNPYAPEYRSTGDPAADKQLAELYKARDALRLQLDPPQ